MKFRQCFVANSSSSSFIINLTKAMSTKFQKLLLKDITYDKYSVISTKEDLLQYFKNEYLSHFYVKDFIICKNTNELIYKYYSKKEYKEEINKTIMIHKEALSRNINRLKEIKQYNSNNEDKILQAKMIETTINYYKNRIQILEKLKNVPHNKVCENNDEFKNIQNKFYQYFKELQTQDIIEIEFNRGGNAPQTELEHRLALMSETDFKNFFKEKYKINIKTIEKIEN